MKILVNDYSGHPFQLELSTALADRGHAVWHAYCSTNVTPRASFDKPGVAVHAISVGDTFHKYDVKRRVIDELRYGWRSARLMRRIGPDRVIASNIPLLSLLVIRFVARLTGTPWVLWLQDVQSGLAQVADANPVVTRVAVAVEQHVIRRADHVVAISPEMATKAIEMGAAVDDVSVVENWAPVQSLPMHPKSNRWSQKHGLEDNFVILYSGTLGVKHSPYLLLDLADFYAVVDESVQIVVVSEGVGADWLQDELAAKPRDNVTVLPFQPFDDLPEVLAAADVLVVLLDSEAAHFSVPSKTLSYLCAGRPVVGSISNANAAASLISHRAGAGFVVEPGDATALCTAVETLRTSPAMATSMGQAAREYAEQHFDISYITDQFERILEERRQR